LPRQAKRFPLGRPYCPAIGPSEQEEKISPYASDEKAVEKNSRHEGGDGSIEDVPFPGEGGRREADAEDGRGDRDRQAEAEDAETVESLRDRGGLALIVICPDGAAAYKNVSDASCVYKTVGGWFGPMTVMMCGNQLQMQQLRTFRSPGAGLARGL
jgi:hypothetical protein